MYMTIIAALRQQRYMDMYLSFVAAYSSHLTCTYRCLVYIQNIMELKKFVGSEMQAGNSHGQFFI